MKTTEPGWHSATWRLATTGVGLLLLAVAAYATLRLTFGERPALVNVRWAVQVDSARRHELEQRYHLRDAKETDSSTFSYELTNLASANIRALVLDPLVEDTHRIHRTAFRVGRFVPRGRYPGRGALWGPLLEAAVVALLAAALAVFSLAAIHRFAPAASRTWAAPAISVVLSPGTASHAVARRVTSLVPEASAEAVALFRIIFGIAILALVASSPVPGAPAWLLPWLLGWGALFVAGAAGRIAFVMLTIGTVVWARVLTEGSSHHPVTTLVLTLVCLSGSRWSDAWSIDAWRRRQRGGTAVAGSARFYGFTLWLPGFVLGLAFAAAAFAKLRESGIAWVLNGTVKYHFLSDAPQAPVDWGLAVGRYPSAAVAMSLAAIVIETLVVVGACSRRYRFRLLAGIGASGLLTGFWLFQGVFWPGWWLLLLSFLPWHRVSSGGHSVRFSGPPSAGPRAEWLQVALITALICQQAVVCAFRLEYSPVVSTYDMYATSYASPADYESKSGAAYWLVAADGRECEVDRVGAEAVSARPMTEPAASRLLRSCFDDTISATAVAVEKREAAIDWERWTLGTERRTPLSAPAF